MFPISVIRFETAAPVKATNFPLAVLVATPESVALTDAVYSGASLFPTGAVNWGVIPFVSNVEAAAGTMDLAEMTEPRLI